MADRQLEEILVDYIADTCYEDLPPNVVLYCKLLVMDSLGVCFPGSRAPGVSELTHLLSGWGSTGGVPILIAGTRTAPPLAALANSAAMHALDFDDTLDASALHTFVSVLPAALAAAQSGDRIGGREFITALVLGVDIICRIGLAIRTPLSWIRTATCGGFGAAAAAGKLLGLDRDAIMNAMGAVYSQTSGNAQGLLEGKLIKRMQPGFAASAGVTAAFMARNKITASRGFLTGTYGYYRLYEQGRVDLDVVVDRLGSRFILNELSIKPYPCCRMTHSAIDAALALRNGPALAGHWAEIERIDVTVSKMVAKMVGKPLVIGSNPQVDAQFSIPYTVACALIRGDVFLGDFETEAVFERQVQDLAGSISVGVDGDLPEKDLTVAKLVVRMKDGRTLEQTNDLPLGNPARPMDRHHCRAKFENCVRYSRLDVTPERLERLFSLIENLEDIPDVCSLMDVMTLPREE